MSTVNRVILVGHLGANPVVKQTESGKEYARLSLATQSWSKDGEGRGRTEWHSIYCYGKNAELAQQFLSQGRRVYVEGYIQSQDYEKQGVRAKRTWVTANQLTFLDSSKKNKAPTATETSEEANVEGHREDLDDFVEPVALEALPLQ